MLIHHTTHDHPRRAGRDNIWLDDPLLDGGEQDEGLEEERDLDLTESGIISQLGLKGLPDDSY